MVTTSKNVSKVITENGKQVLAVYSPTGERLGGVILTPTTPAKASTSTGGTSTAQPSPEKLAWIEAQQAKGAILTPTLQAQAPAYQTPEQQTKQAWIMKQQAKGAILSPSLKAELKASIQQTPTIETGREVSISPAVANKLGLISKQEQQEAEAKGSFFIHRKETVKESPEETMARLRSGDVIAYKDKSTGEVVFANDLSQVPKGVKIVKPEYFSVENGELKTYSVPASTYFQAKREQAYAESVDKKVDRIIDEATNMEKVGMVAHTLLSPSGYSLMSSVLLRKELTGGITPRQVVAQRMGKIGKERIWKQPLEQQINYAVQNAIDNPITQVELATLGGMGITKIASTSLGARALGSTAGKLLLGSLGIASLGYTGKNIAELYATGRKAEASGRILSLVFSVAGGIIGSKIEAGYLAGQQEVRLQPKTVVDRGVRETVKGDTIRFGKVDIINEDNSVIKAEYIGVKKGNIEKYYYKIPKQTIDTVDYGKVTIPEQTILDKSGDLAKIRYYQRTETGGGLTTKETGVKILKGDIKFTTEPEITGMESVKAIDKSLKSIDELTSLTTSDKGISQTVRQGTSEMDYYIEKAFSTPTASVGKGEFFSLETGKPFNYYYFEKTITPKISGISDFTQPVIRGTAGVSGTASTDTIISNTLTRLDSLRQLQEAQLTASINQGNLGRIAPIMPQLKTITENLNMERSNRIVDQAVIASAQGIRIKKREAYYVPSIIDSAMIGALQNIERATKQITGSLQGTRQVQTPAQKFIQEVDLITTPVTRQETRTVTQTRPPRITEINVPQIERPPRIAFPRPFFNANLLGGGKDLESYIRSINHRLMEAMRLVV